MPPATAVSGGRVDAQTRQTGEARVAGHVPVASAGLGPHRAGGRFRRRPAPAPDQEAHHDRNQREAPNATRLKQMHAGNARTFPDRLQRTFWPSRRAAGDPSSNWLRAPPRPGGRPGRRRRCRRCRSSRRGSWPGTAGGSPRRNRTGRGGDLGRDRAVAGSRCSRALVGVARGLGGALLLVVRGVDRRAVLGARVVALAHALGRVVVLPEDLQQLLVADDLRDRRPPARPRCGRSARSRPRGRSGSGVVPAGVADGRDEDAGASPRTSSRRPRSSPCRTSPARSPGGQRRLRAARRSRSDAPGPASSRRGRAAPRPAPATCSSRSSTCRRLWRAPFQGRQPRGMPVKRRMAAPLPRLRADLDIMPSPLPEQPGLIIRDPFRYSDGDAGDAAAARALSRLLRRRAGRGRSARHAGAPGRPGRRRRRRAPTWSTSLHEAGFLDDERFAELRARARARSSPRSPERARRARGRRLPGRAGAADARRCAATSAQAPPEAERPRRGRGATRLGHRRAARQPRGRQRHLRARPTARCPASIAAARRQGSSSSSAPRTTASPIASG